MDRVDHIDHIGFVSVAMVCSAGSEVQTQPRKHVVDNSDHTTPTRQRDLWAVQIRWRRDMFSLTDTDDLWIIHRSSVDRL